MSILKTIPRSSIIHGEGRQREDYGDLSDLVEDLCSEKGQIQTMAVVEEGDGYRLLAGGRRYTAMGIAEEQRGMESGSWPCLVRVYPANLSDIEREEIELAENFHRKDLTWVEEANAVKRIHALQVLKYGNKKPSKNDPEGVSHSNTGDLVGKSRFYVQDNLKLAAAVEQDPELAECKNASEARNLLAKKQEKLVIEELARRATAEKAAAGSPEERAQRLVSQYNVGDFFEWAETQTPASFDLVDFDPPWDCWFEKRKGLSSKESPVIADANKADYTPIGDFESDFDRYIEVISALAKPDAWLLCWYAQEPWGEYVYDTLVKHGWSGMKIPAIWYKAVPGKVSSFPDYYLGRTYETFYYMRRGSAVVRKRGKADVWVQARESNVTRIHPTEKPITLMLDIFETFATPNSKILVPCLGSGNSILAADRAKMTAVGTDISQPFHDAFAAKVMGAFL